MLKKTILALTGAVALASAVGLSVSPAAADPWGWHGGWHHRPGFVFGPPVFVPGPVIYDAPACEMRRVWVRDWRGWHRAWRRYCA